jgi:large subunit ribosomal protein L9
MQVILRETVDKLGRRGEIVKVANGYARNYLLPRKLALPVTDANRKQVERERKVVEAREADEHRAAAALAARLSGLECVIARRVGETDTLYGSVTSADLAEWLATQQIDVDKRKIPLAEPIKHLGEFSVPIKLHGEVTASLKVRVVKDETAE